MARVICVASGKGGTGKTTLTANIGAALTEFDRRVLVIDANLTTPNLGFHLGVPLYPKTLQDAMRNQAKVEETIFTHPSGLSIIPASISMDDLKNTNPKQLGKVIENLMGGEHDIILVDSAAGLGGETLASLEVSDELLVVSNPQLPSITDALKTIKIAEEQGMHILGVVLNRVKGNPSELSIDEVESILGYPIISSIKEDDLVQEGLAAKTPVVFYKPNSTSSVELKKLAASLAGINYQPPVKEKTINFFSKIFNFLK